MSEPIQATVDVVASAAKVIIEQGVLGALVIILLAVCVFLGFLLYKSRKQLIKHMKDQIDAANK